MQNNKEAKVAFNALQNLKHQGHLAKLLPIIEKTEHCLEDQSDGPIQNLAEICGEQGLYYSDEASIQSYLLIGSGHAHAPNLQSHANDTFQIYGNGEDKISCKNIRLSKNSHVTIQAHGEEYRVNHYIDLCKDAGQKTFLLGPSFSEDIKKLSKGQIIHVELVSCHSGAAIHDISYLSKGSTLITLTSAKHAAIQSLQLEIFAQSLNFEHQDNPFIKFASYLFTNPDDTQFALHSKTGSKIFSATIKTIENFASTKVIKWQNKQLDEFLKFCQNIQNNVTKKNAEQIAELLNLFKDDHYRDHWFSKFNVERYKELLLILHLNNGEQDLVNRFLSDSSMDINCKTNDGASPLWLASKNGLIDIVIKLIEAGSLVNNKNNDGTSPLHIAAKNGHTNIVIKLIEAGSLVNNKNNDGASPLWLASKNGHTDIVVKLIEAGSLVNDKDNDGTSPLHIAAQNGLY